MSNNSSSPLVSVIIPTYGRSAYLPRCVCSVLEQSYSAVEIFVVDDNNPDTEARRETEKAMEQFADNPKVHYLRHDKNRNGSAARNTGLRVASGKYVAFLDDDDMFVREKIEKCVARMESLDDSYGMCYSRYCIVKPNGTKEVSVENRSGDCYLAALMRTFFICAGSNLFVKKAVADEINGFDESFRRNQDLEFLVRALENYRIDYIDEVLTEIYQAGTRTNRTFEEVDGYSKFFLEKFMPRIDKLDKKSRKRVISVISLERCRVAFVRKKIGAGFKILRENHVSLLYILRYIRYLIKRVVTKTSFGFDGT